MWFFLGSPPLIGRRLVVDGGASFARLSWWCGACGDVHRVSGDVLKGLPPVSSSGARTSELGTRNPLRYFLRVPPPPRNPMGWQWQARPPQGERETRAVRDGKGKPTSTLPARQTQGVCPPGPVVVPHQLPWPQLVRYVLSLFFLALPLRARPLGCLIRGPSPTIVCNKKRGAGCRTREGILPVHVRPRGRRVGQGLGRGGGDHYPAGSHGKQVSRLPWGRFFPPRQNKDGRLPRETATPPAVQGHGAFHKKRGRGLPPLPSRTVEPAPGPVSLPPGGDVKRASPSHFTCSVFLVCVGQRNAPPPPPFLVDPPRAHPPTTHTHTDTEATALG